MAEKKGGLKGFFGEFKQFITRGNVMDMACLLYTSDAADEL